MRATRIVGRPSLTLPSASSHPTPPSPHALRNTLFVVVVSTLKAVPISIQYLLTSVLVQLTRMPPVVTGQLPQKGTHTLHIFYLFIFFNSWTVRDGSRSSDRAPDEIFREKVLTSPTQIIFEKKNYKKRPDGHKIFRK